MRRRILLLGILMATPARSEAPPPGAWLGFDPSRDGAVIDPGQITAWLERAASASACIRLERIGLSVEGRPLTLALVSAPENLARLDEIRESREKVFILITTGVHPAEVGSNLACIPLVERLACGKSPGAARVLREAVVAFLPAMNPDGAERVAAWLREGGAEAGPPLPFSQHRYAGHDLNRDWLLGTQPETRAVVQRVHDRLRPWITVDLHQMGSNGPRIFLPPYAEPTDPEVPRDLLAQVERLGSRVLERLTRDGVRGAVRRWVYDAWSPARAYPLYHGGLRLLIEVAAARFSSPIHVPAGSIQVFGGGNAASEDHPAPWMGGRWGLPEIAASFIAAVEAILVEALEEPLRSGQGAYLDGRGPAGRVLLRTKGADPGVAAMLLRALILGGVEARRVEEGWIVEDPPWGRGWCRSLLLCAPYPGTARETGDPAPYDTAPYDTASHDLAHLAGIPAEAAAGPAAAAVPGVPPEAGRPAPRLPPGIHEPGRLAAGAMRDAVSTATAPGSWLVTGRSLALFDELADLLEAGTRVSRLSEGCECQGISFRRGDFLIEGLRRPWIERLVARGADAAAIEETAPRPAAAPFRYPSIALVSGAGSRDEGWLRWVLEDHRFRFTLARPGMEGAGAHRGEPDSLSPAEASESDAFAGRERGPGRGRQVFIIPEGVLGLERDRSEPPSQAAPSGPSPQGASKAVNGEPGGEWPSQGVNGVEERTRVLRDAVLRGGRVIALGRSAREVVRRASLPLGEVEPAPALPGTLLPTRFADPGGALLDPILRGPSSPPGVFYNGGPLWKPGPVPGEPHPVGILEVEPLLAVSSRGPRPCGLLRAGDAAAIDGAIALVRIREGSAGGEWILFGFSPHFRGWTAGTFRLLFEAILAE